MDESYVGIKIKTCELLEILYVDKGFIQTQKESFLITRILCAKIKIFRLKTCF